MESIWRVISWEAKGEEWGERHRIKKLIGRYKTDRGMLRTVQEMDKPKDLYS